MSSPTYAQSMQEAKGHGSAFIRSTIGNHPLAAAALLAVLVLVIVVLGYFVFKYHAASKSGFRVGISPYNNLNTNGNSPMWQLGSGDAGNWGPMHRESTAYEVAAYEPGWRAGGRGVGREGLDAGAPDSTAVMVMPAAASVASPAPAPAAPAAMPAHMRQHRRPMRSPFPQVGPQQYCGGWDPSAAVETQALAATGGISGDPAAEGRLQSAVDGAGLNDSQLEQLMHSGGAP